MMPYGHAYTTGGPDADGRASAHEQAQFQAAFAGMQPTNRTVERILNMTTRKPERVTRAKPARRFTVRAAIATVAATALLTSGAYAAVSSDFFQSAFGPKGQQDVGANELVLEEKVNPNTGETSVSYFPERTWSEVDPAVAERLVGAYVEEVGQSVQMNGYTLTVEYCLIDENGLGLATIVLSNPEGLELFDSGVGEVSLANGAPTAVVMGVADETSWSYRMIGDAARSTQTELYATIYFGSFSGTVDERGVSWSLGDNLARAAWKEQRAQELEAGVSPEELTPFEQVWASLVHQPQSAVPAMILTNEAGGSVEVSPLGLTAYSYAAPAYPEYDELNAAVPIPSNPLSPKQITVRYADGSEYVVMRSGAEVPVNNVNTSFSLIDGTGAGFLFNRLVDIDAVESVAVIWLGSESGQFYEIEHVYTR